MYNFWIQIYSNYKGLFEWFELPAYLSNVVVFPILMIFMYAYLGRFTPDVKAAEFFTIGMSASQMIYVMVAGITSVYANDRWLSTISFTLVSRVNRFVNFLSRCLGNFPNGIIIFAICLAMIKITTPINFGTINWLALCLAVFAVNIALCGFAQFLGVFSILFTEFLNILALTLGITFIFSGIIIPLSVFPPPVQEFAKLLPVTNGLIAIRAAFAGSPLSDIYFHIVREVLTGAVYFIIGYVNLTIFEQRARRSGILDTDYLG